MKEKRYFLSVVEECVMNPDFMWGRGGRIEVTDNESDSPYPVYESRWFVPCEVADAFRDLWDFKEFDHLPYLDFNLPDNLDN